MMTMRRDLECRNPKRGCIGMDVLLEMDTLHFAAPSIRDHMKNSV